MRAAFWAMLQCGQTMQLDSRVNEGCLKGDKKQTQLSLYKWEKGVKERREQSKQEL